MTDTAVAQEPKAAPEAEKPVEAEPVEQSLDDLLNEFDSGEPEQKEEKPEKRDPEIERLIQRETQRDIAEAVKSVKESHDVLKGRSDKLVHRYLEGEAAEDKRIQKAWIDREANPKAWSKVLKGLGEKMAKEFEDVPDPQLTADRESARDAVRGSSTDTPPETKITNEDLDGLSDAEFRAKMREMGYRR